MKVQVLLLTIAIGALLAEASPIGSFINSRRASRSSRGETVATVDCNNREAVKFVLKSNANFRCKLGTEAALYKQYSDKHGHPKKFHLDEQNEILGMNILDNHIESDGSFASKNTIYKRNCQNKKIFNPKLQRCVYPNWNKPISSKSSSRASFFPSSLQSASLIRESGDDICGYGFMYSLDADMCLPARSPLNSIPLESRSLVAETPIMEITSFSNSPKSEDDCPEGTMFSPELGFCSEISKSMRPSRLMPALNLVSDNRPLPLEITAFGDSVGTGDNCSRNQIYLAELDICVPLPTRRVAPVFKPQSASLTRRIVTNPPQQVPSDCKEGEFYQSEVGICIKIVKKNHKRRPVSGSLVRDKPALVQPIVAFSEPVRCKTGETFNPSVNVCMPLSATQNVQSAPPSSNLVKEPETLEIQAFKESVSFSDCVSQGKFYISELDICV